MRRSGVRSSSAPPPIRTEKPRLERGFLLYPGMRNSEAASPSGFRPLTFQGGLPQRTRHRRVKARHERLHLRGVIRMFAQPFVDFPVTEVFRQHARLRAIAARLVHEGLRLRAGIVAAR